MNQSIFSFEGRIGRTEYAITSLICGVLVVLVTAISISSPGTSMLAILNLAVVWVHFAQGSKRSHDIGNSGWLTLIPFYGLWLLFAAGVRGTNEYGNDPKVSLNQNPPTQYSTSQSAQAPVSGYQGGYSGGHNTQNQSQSPLTNKSSNSEYKSGDLYK